MPFCSCVCLAGYVNFVNVVFAESTAVAQPMALMARGGQCSGGGQVLQEYVGWLTQN